MSLDPNNLPTFIRPEQLPRPEAKPVYTGAYPMIKVLVVLRQQGAGARMIPIAAGLNDEDISKALGELHQKYPGVHINHEVHDIPLVNPAFEARTGA